MTLFLEKTIYLSIFNYLLIAIIISSLLAIVSYALVIQTPDNEKISSYECGFEPFGDARKKFEVRFYIVAILFLIFDIEVAYMVPWAVTYGNLGVNAYFIVIFFLVILLIGFLYEISKGSLSEYDTFMVQHSTKFKN